MAEKDKNYQQKAPDANVVETKKKRADAATMQMMGAQLTRWAEEKVEKKRKKKGLGDLQPRKKRVASQLFVHGGSMTAATLAIAPLERVRLIH